MLSYNLWYYVDINKHLSQQCPTPIPPRAEGLLTEKWQRRKVGKAPKTCNSYPDAIFK